MKQLVITDQPEANVNKPRALKTWITIFAIVLRASCWIFSRRLGQEAPPDSGVFNLKFNPRGVFIQRS